MFTLDKIQIKQDSMDEYYDIGYSKTIIKETITINKYKNSNCQFIIDTLCILKKMNNNESNMINYINDHNKIIIEFRYEENNKNVTFIDEFKIFINKYKPKYNKIIDL
jgi:hypothetical protein